MGVQDRAIVVETGQRSKRPARLLNPRNIVVRRLQPGRGHPFEWRILLEWSLVGRARVSSREKRRPGHASGEDQTL